MPANPLRLQPHMHNTWTVRCEAVIVRHHTKCAPQTVSVLVDLVSFKQAHIHTIHINSIFRTDKNKKISKKAINFIGCWFYIFISPLRIIQCVIYECVYQMSGRTKCALMFIVYMHNVRCSYSIYTCRLVGYF